MGLPEMAPLFRSLSLQSERWESSPNEESHSLTSHSFVSAHISNGQLHRAHMMENMGKDNGTALYENPNALWAG